MYYLYCPASLHHSNNEMFYQLSDNVVNWDVNRHVHLFTQTTNLYIRNNLQETSQFMVPSSHSGRDDVVTAL